MARTTPGFIQILRLSINGWIDDRASSMGAALAYYTVFSMAPLLLIAAGNANKLIGDRLSISEATAKSHVANILSKLGANDRAHAVTIGLKRGIIDL